MMIKEKFTFQIIIGGKSWNFSGEVVYRGENLVKVEVKIGKRDFLFQKNLLLKNASWSILSTNIPFKNAETAAATILKIFQKLDEILKFQKATYDPQKRKKD